MRAAARQKFWRFTTLHPRGSSSPSRGMSGVPWRAVRRSRFSRCLSAPGVDRRGRDGPSASGRQVEGRGRGEQLATELALDDPVTRVKEGLIARLSAGGEIGRIRTVAAAMESDDLKSLKRALGPAMVLDVKTLGWGRQHTWPTRKRSPFSTECEPGQGQLRTRRVSGSRACSSTMRDGHESSSRRSRSAACGR